MITLKELFNAPLDVTPVESDFSNEKIFKFQVDDAIFELSVELIPCNTESEARKSPVKELLLNSKYNFKYPFTIIYFEFNKKKRGDKYGSTRKDSSRHFVRIFSTVIAEIRNQVDKHPNSILKFYSDLNEPSRVKLYDKMASILGRKDFVIVHHSDSYYKTYYLISKQIIIDQNNS